MNDWLFDGLLMAGLLWLGWSTVSSPNLFRAIVLFIVFGLFMALIWARLAAPDVALAEAAIGAGLTGALLLDAYRVLLTSPPQQESTTSGRVSPDANPFLSAALALLGAVLVAGLGWALLTLPEPAFDPGSMARARVDESGVDHPVTAVLLNFRGYDTLLEITVLLLALLGAWAVGGVPSGMDSSRTTIHASPLMETLIRLLVPVAVLTAGYLLWAGAQAPGGAFQAGAVLAAVGVLLSLSNRFPAILIVPSYLLRFLVAFGLTTFSAVALGVLIGSGNLLEYPALWAGPLILLIESALTLSIALTLALLFHGAPGLSASTSPTPGKDSTPKRAPK